MQIFDYRIELLTPRRAKKISLQIWGDLKNNPSLKSKKDLPYYNRLQSYEAGCPLCSIFHTTTRLGISGCIKSDCPLKGCIRGDADYIAWFNADTDEGRQKAAETIYNKISDWEAPIGIFKSKIIITKVR